MQMSSQPWETSLAVVGEGGPLGQEEWGYLAGPPCLKGGGMWDWRPLLFQDQCAQSYLRMDPCILGPAPQFPHLENGSRAMNFPFSPPLGGALT